MTKKEEVNYLNFSATLIFIDGLWVIESGSLLNLSGSEGTRLAIYSNFLLKIREKLKELNKDQTSMY